MVLEKTLESPLDCKEIQLVHPKGNESWIFNGRTDAEAETPIPWPPDAGNWLIWKEPDAGKDWRWEEKGMAEDEMVGWHHSLTQWTWVWVSSGNWWQTGKPGVLKSMGSQRAGHDWVTELNWCILVAQSCLTLCSPMEYSPAGSSVYGVFQARILEYQITNGIFHRSRTKKFHNLHGNTKDPE